MNTTDWRGPYCRRKAKAASERGRRMARRRWELDRARRERLAARDPAFTGWQILRRIIVIDEEGAAREAVIYAHDSARAARRKLRAVLGRPKGED